MHSVLDMKEKCHKVDPWVRKHKRESLQRRCPSVQLIHSSCLHLINPCNVTQLFPARCSQLEEDAERRILSRGTERRARTSRFLNSSNYNCLAADSFAATNFSCRVATKLTLLALDSSSLLDSSICSMSTTSGRRKSNGGHTSGQGSAAPSTSSSGHGKRPNVLNRNR